jgi:hypothetical protein
MNIHGMARVLSAVLALTAGAAYAESPQLTYLDISPAAVSSSGQLTVTLTASGGRAFDAVYFRQPNGTQGRLEPGEYTEDGTGTYTAVFTVPTGSASGTWRVVEVGVIGTDNSPYRFLASDLFPNSTPCPAFDNIGILACASDVVRDGGAFLVQ